MKKILLTTVVALTLLLTGCGDDEPQNDAERLQKQAHKQRMDEQRLIGNQQLQSQRIEQNAYGNQGYNQGYSNHNSGASDIVTGMVAGALLNSVLNNSSQTRHTTIVNKTYNTNPQNSLTAGNPVVGTKGVVKPSTNYGSKSVNIRTSKPLKATTQRASSSYTKSTRAQSYKPKATSKRAQSRYRSTSKRRSSSRRRR